LIKIRQIRTVRAKKCSAASWSHRESGKERLRIHLAHGPAQGLRARASPSLREMAFCLLGQARRTGVGNQTEQIGAARKN
jgi:hypothetical protein